MLILLANTFTAPAQAEIYINPNPNGYQAKAKDSVGDPYGDTEDSGQGNNGTNQIPVRFTEQWKDAHGGNRWCALRGRQTCMGAIIECSKNTQGQIANSTYQVQRGTQTDNTTGADTDLGYRCANTASQNGTVAAQPIVITVTREEFASLPVQPATAHAGPPGAVLPVSMDLVAYAESSTQTLQTNLLGAPVSVRAIPTSYTWDFGDGNQLTTTRPGQPYPHKDITHRYQHEGWYDVTLTTTYSGQFSVNGGPWQDIDGTIDIASPAVPVYSRSYESRLTDPYDSTPGSKNTPTDGTQNPPPNDEENRGPADPHPTHKTDG